MGISRIAFLFDVNKFKNTFMPLVESLKRKDYSDLKDISTQRVKSNPDLWKVLDSLGYFESDIGNEDQEFDTDEGRVMFWINILIADSCYEAVVAPVNLRLIGEALESLGVNKKLITELQFGNPFGNLFLPQTEQMDWPFWCTRFSVGWLNLEEIKNLSSVLREAQINFVSQNSENGKGLGEILQTITNLTKMLDTVLEKNRGLLLGLSV